MRRTRRATAGLLALVTLLVASLSACDDPLLDVVVTSPGMWPVFHTSAKDYVNRCEAGKPTQVQVRAPAGAVVSINGRPGQRGTFTTTVNQRPNERMSVVITLKGTTTSHFVRCLPPGFPEWDAVRSGAGPQSEFYVTTLMSGFGPTNYPVIFDANGVPIWWTGPSQSILTTPLGNGNLATLPVTGGMVEHRLDGSTVRVLDTEGAPSDFHDVLLLPNGNYALVTGDYRPCDLSAWGRPAGECLYHEVQVLTPTGDVVWRWRPEDHIPITETPPRWRSAVDPIRAAVDPWHWNAIEWTGDGFLLSLRHQDAIYKVDYATGTIDWKLGGAARPESLRVLGDRIFTVGGSISGQHDVRLQPDGTITVFDNRTASGIDLRPRVARYRVDERARTATLVKEVRDPIAPSSACCGSARVLPTGNYVVGWGGSPWFTENEPDGTQVFRLEGIIVYRAVPVPRGQMDTETIRRGMDAQYDGLTPTATARSGPSLPPPDPAEQGDPATRLGIDLPQG